MREYVNKTNIKTIYVGDWGIKPDTREDVGPSLNKLLNDIAKEGVPVILEFEKGRYDFYHETGIKQPYFISNTISEVECSDITKCIGIYIKAMNQVILEGNESLFIFHGKMTTMVIDESDAIEVRNIHIDFERPTMSEVSVEHIGEDYIDFRVNKDSWYKIDRERVIWVGEGFAYTDGPSQVYDPKNNTTWRTWNPIAEAERVIELEPCLLRAYYKTMKPTEVGHVFQMRDGIRDQVGALIHRSEEVTFSNTCFHYMHGLGIVGQYSEDLTFDHIRCQPRELTGRTATGFADFMQISGCRGKVSITHSKFVGAHDDPINVHGTHLQIVEQRSPYEVIVRFMHHQTYGMDAVFVGDSIDFIDAQALVVKGHACVMEVEKLNPREVRIVCDHPIPPYIAVGDVIENATWTPEVVIKDNYFARIATRGILMTTRKKVVIENNVFERMQMSGILVADDAQSWYESGMVTDLTISNNQFIECGSPVIHIAPENTVIDVQNPVHRNIRIEGNQIITHHEQILDIKSTKGITFTDNQIECTQNDVVPRIRLIACSEVDLMAEGVEIEAR